MTVVHTVFKSAYAQPTGVVFAGRNGLDTVELRLGVVRIPEVSLRIREAQAILDSLDVERFDLLGATITENEYFFRNIKMKSLLAAIVQVGLYDRFLKTQRAPTLLVGAANGDSALLVCANQISFETMVRNSAAFLTLAPREGANDSAAAVLTAAVTAAVPAGVNAKAAFPSNAVLGLLPGYQVPMAETTFAVAASGTGFSGGSMTSYEPAHTGPLLTILPSLSGLNLTEYRAFMRSEEGLSEVGQPVLDLKKLLTEVVQHQAVSRFVNIGPGEAIPSLEYEQIAEAAESDEVTIIDSIDLDPMLNWFWKEMRPVAVC